MTPNPGDSEPVPRVVAVWRIRDFHDEGSRRERFVNPAGDKTEATLTTQDYLEAISRTRPTLTPAMVDAFNADIESFARL